ncbi:chemotaxis protein CheA [Desulfobacterales bacterium HSG2]|nr:chemotaxis protein CheA [Desulfobacterales bacterium HSG2]
MTYAIKITPEMKRQFRSETTEHLNNFEKMLMVLEKEPGSHEAIHTAFRHIHSLKGNSDYLGIRDINLLSYELEDIMDEIRSGRVSVDEDVLAILFEGLDLLRDMNRRIADEVYEESDISDIRERIRQVKALGGEGAGTEKSAAPYSVLFSNMLEQEIKVDLGKIDEFMSHVSEFTIAKNVLNYVTKKVISQKHASGLAGELKKVSADISRIADTLQNNVIKLRLIKINTLFERLPRIVRDLSKREGKDIDLNLSGGETEIDRRTIDQLIDPLIHLIRNSVDHGIEPPDERAGKGKPETGVVTVSAYQEGSHAVIDVIDDGRGFDAGKISESALKKNLITRDMLVSMNEEDIINLVFMPGFSTISGVADVSGRGVGLDIVKNNIKMIGGSVILSGTRDAMTRVRLRVPVSISVADVLLTETAGRRYAFPFSSILKTVKVRKKDIHGPEKGEFILFDGTVLAVKYLGEILETAKTGRLRENDSDEELSVVVISFGGHIRGIVVDDILNRENIMIKPLEKCLAGIKEFSGAALLGDGGVVLVIDPMGMV